MTQKQLLAGAVQIDITPPIGTRMEGYAAREEVSQGIHDPLLAQMLLLSSGEEQVVLISLDLLGVDLEFTHRVREGVEKAIGTARDGIFVACSHTHAGPAGFMSIIPGLPFKRDPELQYMVERKVIDAAIRVRERLQPVKIGIGKGLVVGIGRNRNDPENGPIDNELLVLRMDDAEGIPLAVVFNYGCHPTVLGYENLLISADYPGAARAELQRIFPQTVFLYTNGASGDVSTRFTRREQTFAEVDRMGHILAGKVLKVMEMVVTDEEHHLAGIVEPIELPFRAFPPHDKAEALAYELEAELKVLEASGASHGDIRRAKTRLEGATIQSNFAKGLAGQRHMATELQVLEIGPLSLLGLPGEPFARIVLEVKAKSKAPYTAVVSNANHEVGYFPDAESFAAGTYEGLSSPYQEDIAEIITRRGLALLERGRDVRN